MEGGEGGRCEEEGTKVGKVWEGGVTGMKGARGVEHLEKGKLSHGLFDAFFTWCC